MGYTESVNKHGRPRKRLLVMATGMLLGAATAAAQAPPGPVRPAKSPEEQRPARERPAEEKDRAQIRVRVELVTTPVTVRTSSGEIVYDLNPRDFRVFDNGVEQRIEEFDMGGDPLSLVLLFQTSSRIEPFLPRLRQTGILFAQSVLGQTGEAAVIAFHDRIEVVQETTSDPDAVQKAIEKLPAGTSGVRLHDALSRAVRLLRDRPEDRRRVIVVISEAADTDSENALGGVLREAQLEQITIYTIGLSTTAAMLRSEPRQTGLDRPFPPGTFPTPGIPGRAQTPGSEQVAGRVDIMQAIKVLVSTAANAAGENVLEVASAATGGMHTGTFRERAIEAAISNISSELHSQYTLTYRPRGVASEGYHEIRVSVARPGVVVRARPGYYVPPEDASASDGQKKP